MLNTVGTRVNSGCYDNRHWKFKDSAAGWIPCKEDYFTLKLHTTATVSMKHVKQIHMQAILSKDNLISVSETMFITLAYISSS